MYKPWSHDQILHFARLKRYRDVMNRIHENGNIFYDRSRFDAYAILAKLASDERRREF